MPDSSWIFPLTSSRRRTSADRMARLVVLFDAAETAEDLGPDDCVLSFLPPVAEQAVIAQAGRVLSGRVLAAGVRAAAVDAYVDVSVRLGLVTDDRGRTFRSLLRRPDSCSEWWYHPISFKDCEQEPVLGWMVSLLVVDRALDETGADILDVHGAPAALMRALRSKHRVRAGRVRASAPRAALMARGLASRAVSAARLLAEAAIARVVSRPARHAFDVLFTGYWPGSVTWNAGLSAVDDRYLKDLPGRLSVDHGLRAGWIAWLRPDSLGVRSMLRPVPGEAANHVVLLQRFVGVRDVLRAFASTRALRIYLRWRRRRRFDCACAWNGFDLSALFDDVMLRGFAGPMLAYYRLVALATRRACERLRPRATLSHLEHHLQARAHYEGVRRAGTGTTCLTMQHASVSREKTFYALDPVREFAGRPDDSPVPVPDRVYAMGPQAVRHFRAWGYHESQVLPTGSARFDYLPSLRHDVAVASRDRQSAPATQVLVVPSLSDAVEIDLVEAAYLAAAGVSAIRLVVRLHPLSGLRSHARWRAIEPHVELSRASLADDLARADVVLFSYSTVADEAVACGKPVLRWAPVTFDGSAVAEVADVPTFGTVVELRGALLRLTSPPPEEPVGEDVTGELTHQLFGIPDGLAASRIADDIAGIVSVRRPV